MPLPALIGAAGTIAGALLGNKQSSDYSKQAANLAYQRQVEQWNRENEYNAPIAQMERYSQAGLNPNLIYNQSNTSGSLPSVQQAETPHFDNPLSSLGSFADSAVRRILELRSFDLNQQTQLEQQNTMRAQQEYYKSLANKNNYETDYSRSIEGLRTSLLRAGVEEKRANTIVQEARKALIEAQRDNVLLGNTMMSLNNEFLSRTMQGRIDAVDLENSVLRAQKKELESRSKLNDEEKERLSMINFMLRLNKDWLSDDRVFTLPDGTKVTRTQAYNEGALLGDFWNTMNSAHDYGFNSSFDKIKLSYYTDWYNSGTHPNGKFWHDFPTLLIRGLPFFKFNSGWNPVSFH